MAEKDYIPAFMARGLTLPAGFLRKMKQLRAARDSRQPIHLDHFEISAVLPKVKDIRKVKLPGNGVAFTPLQSRPDKFVDIRDHYAGADGLLYLRTSLTLKKGGSGQLLCGPDGPFQVWVNGRAAGSDPNCSNPAGPGKYRLAVTWKRGANEVVFAMHTNGAKAWGLYAQYRLG